MVLIFVLVRGEVKILRTKIPDHLETGLTKLRCDLNTGPFGNQPLFVWISSAWVFKTQPFENRAFVNRTRTDNLMI
jgi:hypothetical protein